MKVWLTAPATILNRVPAVADQSGEEGIGLFIPPNDSMTLTVFGFHEGHPGTGDD